MKLYSGPYMEVDAADNVNHPRHYIRGGMECIDCIKALVAGRVGIAAVCLGNAVKYMWRYAEKGGVEGLKKAVWYLNYLIKELEEDVMA